MTTDPDRPGRQSPSLVRMVELISKENPFQRRQIEALLARQDTAYWDFVEPLLAQLDAAYFRGDDERIAAARAYNRLCMDYVREQIVFRKTGTYPVDAARAYDTVYSRPEVMRYYMIGLLLTYVFWPNQYAMFRFFREHLATRPIDRYLEVGVGHGLFVAESLRAAPRCWATLVDISETSIAVARELLAALRVDLARARFVLGDFLTVDLPPEGFDFIVLGEVLEHVDNPAQFLLRAGELLAPEGTMYVSTCVNCPAIDHVYHFHTVDEIRQLIAEAGLAVSNEFAQAADDVPPSRWQETLTPVNYCAIVAAEKSSAGAQARRRPVAIPRED